MNLKIFIQRTGAERPTMTGEDKRSALYESARQLFAEKGFKDTSVADITKRAGVAVGTFYIHYPSKDRLFIDIFKTENERMFEGMSEHVDWKRRTEGGGARAPRV
jgi:AcrR family transcriptional regulator